MGIGSNFAKERSLAAWEVDERDFPRDAAISAQLEFLVRYAVLAPSSHNSQPWLFRVRNNALELFADSSRALGACDPEDRELRISCGAALGHAALAAVHFGFAPEIAILPDGGMSDLLARLSLGAPQKETPEQARRFAAITKRRTSRTAFAANSAHPRDLEMLKTIAAQHGVSAKIIDQPEMRQRVCEIVAAADRTQMGNPAFREELSKWMRRRSGDSSDGMSVASFGYNDIFSPAAAAVLRTFDMGAGVAARDRELITGSPVLLLLLTDKDEPEAWIKTGLALSDILLEATAAGLSTAYLNQPIELPDRRAALRGATGTHGDPQLLLRMGKGQDVPPSARREAYRVIGG